MNYKIIKKLEYRLGSPIRATLRQLLRYPQMHITLQDDGKWRIDIYGPQKGVHSRKRDTTYVTTEHDLPRLAASLVLRYRMVHDNIIWKYPPEGSVGAVGDALKSCPPSPQTEVTNEVVDAPQSAGVGVE